VRLVNKPAMIPVLPGGCFYENTVLLRLKKFDAEDHMNAPVHRLGRGTSGALLIARSKIACSQLGNAFQTKQVKKIYLALLKGIVKEDKFEVNAKIGKTPYRHTRLSGTVWCAADNGKPSLSYFKVLERNDVLQCTLCKVRIITGRNNQIRIHSAYYGHPLVNDPFYAEGGILKETDDCDMDGEEVEGMVVDEKPRGPVPGDGGYLLHSWKVWFPHPTSSEIIQICCSPPEHFKYFITQETIQKLGL